MPVPLDNRTALVTGASSGLGVDFARELARRGADIVLLARSEGPLQALAAELRDTHAVNVRVEVADIGSAAAADELKQRLDAAGVHIDILVNNAGFGLYGHFLEIGAEREQAMIDLDIASLARMTRLFAAEMKERGWGRILQVASVGAYQPSPTYATYSAAKAFVLSYSHAINKELKGTGVSCTVVSPGVTATRFLEVAGQDATLYQRLFMMQPADVARIAIKALLRRRAEIIPGFLNWLLAQSVRFVPRSVAAAMTHRLMV